ncbi:MAG TPA: hypothetical protein PLK31_05255, partial [Chloroflexota bacterium]|nr:hypothetical protein [Chloroflexota bacterium]
MPAFKKRALSLYLRNKCERQFALYLYTDKERKQYSMPTRHQRAGLGIVGQAGFKWQDEKIRELSDVFGKDLVVENPHGTATRPGTLALKDTLPTVRPYQFIVEGSYEADTLTFRQTIGLIRLTDFYGHEVEIGSTRPDIIQVFPSAELGGAPTTSLEPDPYSLAVEANGNLVPLSANDTRMRLRVIDIKLTSEPGAHYFAEVVYYSMTLAAWLEEAGLSDRFVVIGAPAVWPGSHEASKLSEKLRLWRQRAYEPSHEELAIALEDDLETATFDVFAPRLRTLLSEELPRMLSKRWDELSWHVDYRCKGCEFLSPNLDNEHEDDNAKLRCYLTAEREQNLSRINGLTKGASEQLRQQNVINIEQLADTDSKSLVFDAHHGLKTKRASHPYRAQALLKGTTSVIPNSGGDALMPKFPALRIYIYLDYDLSSALTTSMAIRANWRENLPYNSLLESQTRSWTLRSGEDEVFLVDTPKIERERAEFLKFLGQLARILDEVRNQDAIDYQANRRNDKTRRSTYQIYLWDESQKKHLIRLISRHLPYVLADASLSELVWLFPPPEMLQDANEATRSSAITLVKTVVENTVAIDIPHYYSLLDLARRVTPNDFAKPSVHPLYEEQFSDLIPMERLHEYWQRSGQWTTTQERIMQATRSKVIGLQYVASWLARQLADVLSNLA